ncbi:MAG: class I SAM-dependent methyltransferase [Chloroflexi bacterium]|nr:class I SAM-dependent methyltransferase [Chloroflexota bacterium]
MVSQWSDTDYLRTQQYGTSANLDARAELHRRFRTNPQPWPRWAFEQCTFPARARILEIGCGPGWLWSENQDRLATGWHITLSDFSPGMVLEAQASLRNAPPIFHFEVFDAQHIPFEDAVFDAVVANHMLYHVPNLDAALAEVRRVLKPGGTFYAATNGINHLQRIHDLIRAFAPEYDVHARNTQLRHKFSLENGRDWLARHFDTVRLRLYDDSLVVTEIGALVAYILSDPVGAAAVMPRLPAFTRFLEKQVDPSGAITIAKSSGLFFAQRL